MVTRSLGEISFLMDWARFLKFDKIINKKEDKKVKMNESDYEYYCAFKNKKEDKKVKKEVNFKGLPYWNVKVIKVEKTKKEKVKCEHYDNPYCEGGFICPICGKVLFHKPETKKANIVNGENLDKIKFPCLCSYVLDGKKAYGELDYVGYNRKNIYLKELTEQKRKYDQPYYTEFTIRNLDQIIIVRNIHILKGKIIIFEEVK